MLPVSYQCFDCSLKYSIPYSLNYYLVNVLLIYVPRNNYYRAGHLAFVSNTNALSSTFCKPHYFF